MRAGLLTGDDSKSRKTWFITSDGLCGTELATCGQSLNFSISGPTLSATKSFCTKCSALSFKNVSMNILLSSMALFNHIFCETWEVIHPVTNC